MSGKLEKYAGGAKLPLPDNVIQLPQLPGPSPIEDELVAAQALVAELKSRRFMLEDLLSPVNNDKEAEIEDDDKALGKSETDEEMKREFSGAGAAGGYTLPVGYERKRS